MNQTGAIRRWALSMGAVGLGLTATFAMGVVQPSVAHAAASISNVSFKAPVHTSYSHATGGGTWNTGSTVYVKGELQATDYRCDEWASFMVLIEVPTNPDITAGLKARVSVDFTLDSTGQTGVALVPDTSAAHLAVNHPLTVGTSTAGTHDLAGTPLDDGFVPKAVPSASISRSTSGGLVGDDPSITYYKGTWPGTPANLYESGADARLEFTVLDLNPTFGTATKTVVRMDAQIKCKPGASPTGNLQASLMSVVADGTAGGTRPETISGGAQTVNFRGVGRLGGLGGASVLEPALSVTKLVVGAAVACPVITADAYPPTGDRITTIDNSLRTVKYCYYVKNTGTGPAYGVTVSDDDATIDDASDDFSVSLSGLTSIDRQGSNDDLAAGSLAVGEQVVVYASVGTFTNVATASALNMTSTSTATARVTNLGIVAFNKTILLPGESSCATGATSKYLAIDSTEATESITYCFAITNYLGFDLLNLTMSIVDDNATTDVADDDTITTFTGLTTIDGTGSNNDLANNATAYASLTIPNLSTATSSYVNTATATISGTVNDGVPTPYSESPTSKAKLVFNEFVESQYVQDPPLRGELTITKRQTSPSPVKAGDTIEYVITVTNTGNVALDDVTITDPNAVLGTCSPSNPVAQLRVNLSITCSATHVVTAADAESGQVSNTAFVVAKNGGELMGQVASSDVITPVEKAGVTELKKTPKDSAAGRAGDRSPGSLPNTGYDTSGMLLGVWALVFGSLAVIWSGRRRRI